MYEIISKEMWHTCHICNKTIQEIRKEQKEGNGVYFRQSFLRHLIEEHKMTVEDYFIKIIKLTPPVCKCGICGKQVGINKSLSNFAWREYACGRNEGVKKWSKEAKIKRCGSGNPMYQKKPWNYGLTQEDSESIRRMVEKSKSRIVSEETRRKISQAWKDGRIKPGHTMPHSEETKEKIRQKTLAQIKRGCFSHLKSKPHIAVSLIMDELKVKYREEEVVEYFSFDFYLVDYDIYVEVDGDYFHVNPKMYPNGPQTKTQKINSYRDYKKNKFVKERKMVLYRFWEDDIINNREAVKEKIRKIINESG